MVLCLDVGSRSLSPAAAAFPSSSHVGRSADDGVDVMTEQSTEPEKGNRRLI